MEKLTELNLWGVFKLRNNLDTVGQTYNNEDIVESLADIWNLAVMVSRRMDVPEGELLVNDKSSPSDEFVDAFINSIKS